MTVFLDLFEETRCLINGPDGKSNCKALLRPGVLPRLPGPGYSVSLNSLRAVHSDASMPGKINSRNLSKVKLIGSGE